MEGVGRWQINPKPNKNGREGEAWQGRPMCSTAGGTWSILGLAGEQEKRKIACTSSEDVVRSELLRGGDAATIPSGTQDCPGSVASLAGEGPVPPPPRLQGRVGEFGCWCGWGLRIPQLRLRPLAPGSGWAARGPAVTLHPVLSTAWCSSSLGRAGSAVLLR